MPTQCARRRALALLLTSVILVGGCGKPAVSGNLLPTESERSGLPWLRVDVRLIRGTLSDLLSPLAAKHREDAESEARTQVLEAARSARSATADAAQRAQAALTGTQSAVDPRVLRACLPAAEARLAAAKRGHRDALSDLAPRIAAAGVTASQPAQVIAQLRAAIQVKVDGESRRLRDEYLSRELVQQSGTVLAAGSRMDRLCWSVQNKRDVAARFRGLTVMYNGRELPAAVAAQLWRLPPREKALRIPSSRGVDNDLLPPGVHYEACFYASNAAIPVDVLNRYGLSTENPNRNGDWRIRWDDIELVGEAMARSSNGSANGQRAADPLLTVFADQLRRFEAQLEERTLIEAVQSSPSASAVAQAEAALLTCHRAREKEKALRDVDRLIQAIESGKSDDVSIRARVRPLAQQLLRDPKRIATWITEARALLDSRTAARQEQELGAAYRFADVEPGQYTLLATSAIETTRPKVWLIPLEVKGPVAQDLVAATAQDVALRQTLENVLLGNKS